MLIREQIKGSPPPQLFQTWQDGQRGRESLNFWVKWKRITAPCWLYSFNHRRTHTTDAFLCAGLGVCVSVCVSLYVGHGVGGGVTLGQRSNNRRDKSLDANYHQN